MKEQELWKVHDSSKIQGYLHCERRYFFEHVLGWRTKTPSIHLTFGSAWHRVMEVLFEDGYGTDAMIKAGKAFESEYREVFPPDWDESNKPKNLFNAIRAIPQYVAHYGRADAEDFEVLHIEVSGSVAVSSTKSVHFKTDTILRNREGMYLSMEHKTSGRFSTTWAKQWRQKFQVGTYNHVLNSMYPPNEVYGVMINGFFVTGPPKMKKDGSPYAGATDNEFHRVPVRMNLDSMNGWLHDALNYITRIEDDFDRLASASEGDSILEAFPRNRESCTDFGGCPFLDYCSVWNNPLQHAEEPPLGYHVEHWDPRQRDHAKETVQL